MFQAFIVFPWWFSVLHLFAVLGREEEEAERLSYMSLKRSSASASAFPVMINSAAHSWSYGGGGGSATHQHNHRHDQQCRECAMLARDSSTAKFSDLQCVI